MKRKWWLNHHHRNMNDEWEEDDGQEDKNMFGVTLFLTLPGYAYNPQISGRRYSWSQFLNTRTSQPHPYRWTNHIVGHYSYFHNGSVNCNICLLKK